MPKILVVDDAEEIRKLVSYSLRAAGYDTVLAASGAEALSVVENEPPDLMVLDVMMPGMSGFDVLRTLRTRFAHLDVPVILLTAKSELGDKAQGFEYGAEDYVTKPFAPRELAMRVAAHLRVRDERLRLREQAQADALTGIANRRLLMERAAQELSSAQRHEQELSLVLWDIDHFKHINDTYGHPCGDVILRDLARGIASQVRREDLLGRYGGEEFVLLMPLTPPAEALVTADRIRAGIYAREFVYEGERVHVSVSAGVAGYPRDGVQTVDELVQLADKRMYVAKHLGRNRVIGPEAAGETSGEAAA